MDGPALEALLALVSGPGGPPQTQALDAAVVSASAALSVLASLAAALAAGTSLALAGATAEAQRRGCARGALFEAAARRLQVLRALEEALADALDARDAPRLKVPTAYLRWLLFFLSPTHPP